MLVVANIDNKKISNVVRKTCILRRMISLIKGKKIRKQFDEKVIELVNVVMQNFWGHLKYVVLRSCDEVCGKNMGRRSKGDACWWNGEVM